MASTVSEVGRRVLIGTSTEQTNNNTPFSINANVALSTKVPAIATRTIGNIAAAIGSLPKHSSGVLEATLIIEGTAVSRFRTDGVAATTAVGQLVQAPTATVPVILIVRGEDVIRGFNIIGTGNTATVSFAIAEV